MWSVLLLVVTNTLKMVAGSVFLENSFFFFFSFVFVFVCFFFLSKFAESLRFVNNKFQNGLAMTFSIFLLV